MAVVDQIISSVSLEENSQGDPPEDGSQGTANNQSSQNQTAQNGGDTGQQVSQTGVDQGGKATVPEDHPTKLGRRVSRMEERLESMFDKLDSFMSQSGSGARRAEPETEFGGVPPYYTPEEDGAPDHLKETVVAVKQELAREAQRAEEAQQKYAEKYIREVEKGFGESDEELHNAVVKELLHTNFKAYGKHTGNPDKDARINYGLAIAEVLRRQRTGARPAPNVKGDQQNAPTEVSSATHLGAPPIKKIELDEFSKKFLQAVGAKEDDPWVLESLGRK